MDRMGIPLLILHKQDSENLFPKQINQFDNARYPTRNDLSSSADMNMMDKIRQIGNMFCVIPSLL